MWFCCNDVFIFMYFSLTTDRLHRPSVWSEIVRLQSTIFF